MTKRKKPMATFASTSDDIVLDDFVGFSEPHDLAKELQHITGRTDFGELSDEQFRQLSRFGRIVKHYRNERNSVVMLRDDLYQLLIVVLKGGGKPHFAFMADQG